jgi:hypothetical protein
MNRKLRSTLLSALILVGISALVATPAAAQTRLGIHVTQEELNIWKQRAQSGPYRVAGDVQTNSPGDWTRIINNANSFLNNPSNERWSGQPAGSCWSYKSNPPALPNRNWGERMRDAAFAFLITGTTTYRDAVLNELLAQAATAGTTWADSTRWNTGTNCAYGDAWSWQITMWLTKLLYAYDYIRPTISSSNRSTLDTWFLNAAVLWDDNVRKIIETRFPNRDKDDYSTWGSGYPVCIAGPILTHLGGFGHCDFHEGWNNRSANHVRFFGLVGIMTNNSALKTRSKRWLKEWIRFANFADSTNSQFHRSISDRAAGIGWNYTALMIGGMVTLADAFARIGDSELYNYSTSLGDPSGTLTPGGGPKSLLSVTKKFLDYVDGTVKRYATTNSANDGNANYKIDSVDEVLGAAWISDSYVIPGNLFWLDSRVTAVYRRAASGAPAYPSNPSSFGGCVYCGDWSTLPGVFFMFGQMEGKVNPYSGAESEAPSPPTTSSSIVTVSSTYPGYTTAPVDDGLIDAKGGTSTTWASAESSTADHWVNIALSSPQQINTVTIHWAYNNYQQKYMTSQSVKVQYWNGTSYVDVATLMYPGSDVPSSKASFPAVTTAQLRFYQPANQGNPSYSTVFWVTEIDYENATTAPTSPTSLTLNPTQ